jgi:ArsR family transcriptional regulator
LNSSIREIYETRARIIKAMAHPTRLFIIDKLTEKEYCVCELTEMVGVDISTLSKHLSVMKSAGLLKTRREGNTIYYSLTCECITKYLSCVDGVIKNNARLHNKLVRIIGE